MTGSDGFVLEVTLVAVLILINGFFAGAEIAVISARRARIQPRAQAGDRRAQSLLRLKADPDRFLATVQIGVTLVAPWLRQWAASPPSNGLNRSSSRCRCRGCGNWPSPAPRHAEPLALLVARPIDWLSRAARSAVVVLTAATGLVLRLIGQRAQKENPFHTVDDIRAILDEADEQGVLDGQVVKGAVEFQDCEARHLMTPRSRVVGIPRGTSIEAALRVARESGYSAGREQRHDPAALARGKCQNQAKRTIGGAWPTAGRWSDGLGRRGRSAAGNPGSTRRGHGRFKEKRGRRGTRTAAAIAGFSAKSASS